MIFDTTDWTNIQGKAHPGYGRCIYCGSDGGPDGLRDEHIIPFSLGGNTVIKEASCTSCEAITNRGDTHLARQVYHAFRIHSKVQTRNPKQRPTSLPATFVVDGEEAEMNLPIEAHPFSLVLPIWGDAGFLRNATIEEHFPEPLWNSYNFAPDNLAQTLNIKDQKEILVKQRTNVDTVLFARAIAKIAYCHAVLKFGLDGFRKLVLPDIVLGKCPAVSYFVGSPQITPAPRQEGVLHAMAFQEFRSIPGNTKLHIVGIRLFANSASGNHGMPFYHVIVGAPLMVDHTTRSEEERALARFLQKSSLYNGGKILAGAP